MNTTGSFPRSHIKISHKRCQRLGPHWTLLAPGPCLGARAGHRARLPDPFARSEQEVSGEMKVRHLDDAMRVARMNPQDFEVVRACEAARRS